MTDHNKAQAGKFRKKPVIIEAIQYPLNEYADNPLEFRDPIPQWLHDAVERGDIVPAFESEDYWYLYIKTLEGNMRCSPNDWIIQGVKGELYPCRNDIFMATYERIQ